MRNHLECFVFVALLSILQVQQQFDTILEVGRHPVSEQFGHGVLPPKDLGVLCSPSFLLCWLEIAKLLYMNKLS
jgi:hypothetical protein